MNRKLKYVLLGVLFTTGAACTFTSCTDYDDDIETLQEQIDTLSALHDSEISSVESTLSTLQSTATTLSSKISSVEDDLDDAVDALNESIEALATADDALETAISANSSDITALQSTVTSLTTAVETIGDVVTSLQSELASLTAAYEQVSAAITTLEAAVAENAAGVATNAEAIAALEAALTEANAAIAAAQDAAADAAAAAANAQSDVDALEVVVDGLSSDLSSLTSDLSSLTSDLSSLSADVDDLQGIVSDLSSAQTEIESRLSVVESDVKDALAQVAAAQADATSALTQIAVLDSLTNASLEALSEAIAANGEDIAALKTFKEEAEQRIADLEAYKEEVEAELSEIELDIDALEDALADLGVDVDDLKSSLSSYQSETSDALAALDDRVAVVEALLDAIYGTTEDGGTLTELQSSINSVEEELQAEIDALTEEVETLSATVATIQTNIQDMYGLLSAQLKSLVFVPEAYVDGVPAVVFSKLTAGVLEVSDQDTDGEAYEAGSDEVVLSKNDTATYVVNPSNAEINVAKLDIYPVEAKYYTSGTRTAAIDFDLGIDYDGVVYDGPHTGGKSLLYVPLIATGTAATGSDISTFALQYALDDSLIITSDFASVYQEEIEDIYIGQKQGYNGVTADVHYRTEAYNEDTEATILYNNYTAGSGYYGPRYYIGDEGDEDDYTKDYDLELLYNASLNLDTVVCVHYACEDGTYNSELNLDDYGLTLSYEPVKNYVAGDDTETPQHNFLDINGSVITPTTMGGSTNNQAAIGKAPIVRILLKHESDIIAVAYIKVKIVEEATVTLDESYKIELATAEFDCEGGDTITTTVAQTDSILSMLNDGVGYSKKYFFGNYEPAYLTDDDGNEVEDEDGNPGVGDNDYDEDSYVVLVGLDDYTSTTPVFKWYLTASYMYENSGKTLTYPITFTYGASTVTITLTTTLPEVDSELDLVSTGQIFSDYWYTSSEGQLNSTYSDIDHTEFNATVPGYFSDAKDLFVSSLRDIFIYNDEGYFTLNDENVAVDFYFHEDMEDITSIGGIGVTFTISDDGLSLYGKLTDDTEEWGEQLIATIDNENSDYVSAKNLYSTQIIVYNDGTEYDNNVAELLLNSGAEEMYVLIGMSGYYTCDEDFEVEVLFNGKEYFKGYYLRPINVGGESEAVFADGGSDSYVGASIDITDLLDLTDWNGWTVEGFDKAYSGYTFYYHYGISSDGETLNIAVDTDDVTRITSTGTETKLGDLGVVTYDEDKGTLTYINTSNTISGDNYFYLSVPVTITYDWGELTQTVKVKVVSVAVYEANYAE